jgi:hypothetical protein
MKENPQKAKDMFDNHHPVINRLVIADFRAGKRDEYLGAPYWVYDDNNVAYCDALPMEPNNNESFNGSEHTAIPDEYFFEEQDQNPDQRFQLPLGNHGLPPPRPMTPRPIPFGQVVTRAGRVVNPPDRYGFGNDATMLDALPPSPTPKGLEDSQWANLSVLLINEPKSY